MTGGIGADHIECTRVDFGPGSGPSFSDYRAWVRVLEVIKELFP